MSVSRRFARLGAVVSALVVAAIALAPAAVAHAQVEITNPTAGARLTVSPTTLSVTFNEAVELSFGSMRLFDSTGKPVTLGDVGHPDGKSSVVSAAIAVTLPPGGYVVGWRAVSADSHPVQGAFTFRVGTTGTDATSAVIAKVLSSSSASKAVGFGFGVVRWIEFAFVALVIGGFAFVTLSTPNALSRRGIARLVSSATAVSALATLAAVAFQGASAKGAGGLGDVFDHRVWSDVLRTRFGHAAEFRLVALVVAALAAAQLVRASARTWWQVVAALASAGIAASFALAGHANTGDQAAIGVVSDSLHILAMSSWLGGLVILATIVLPQAATPVSALAGWSKQATVTVVVLVATGVTQSARELGGLSGVLDTTYGRLLVAKVLLVAVTLLIASRSRAVVVVPAAADDDPTAAPADRRGLLRRAVLFEVAVLVVVVALTSALVETAPAKSISSGPAELTLTQDGLTADIIVDPARKGANELHLTFSFPSGSLTPITQVSVNLTLPERSLGPIAVPVDIAGPNHFIANLVDIPIAGTWQVEVLARRSEFSETRFAGAVIVR